jgi:fibrillarin-like pre-rRNA processing protein
VGTVNSAVSWGGSILSARLSNHPKFEGVFRIDQAEKRQLATMSLALGKSVYGEMIYRIDGVEYRAWDPYRSKLAAATLKGLEENPIRPGSRVLYLGAASGTTVSHVSDVIGSKGVVYAVEFAQRSFRDLVENVCKDRPNIVPIFADARFPMKYRSLVPSVGVVYCDIAQQDQTRIMVENMRTYLEKGGQYLLVVKSRSIDVSKEPADVIKAEAAFLERNGYTVEEKIRLEPFEKDHAMLRGRKKEQE